MAKSQPPTPSPADSRLLDDLEISGFTDQDGNFYVRFELGSREVVMTLEEATEVSGLARALARAGIPLIAPKLRTAVLNRVQGIDEWPQTTFVARQPGPCCGAFVTPDGKIVGKPTAEHLVPKFEEPAVPLARGGTFYKWRAAVRQFGRGQSYIQFVCALALTGPILALLAYAGNVLFEMAGASSRGKTTTLNVSASVWGALYKMAGSIVGSWRMTDVGMERLLFARAGTFLPIDEVNSAGVSKALQGAMVGAAAFLLGEGTSKVTDHRRTVRNARIAGYSTSNAAISELPNGADADATKVRFITLPVEAGAGLGIWDKLPRGFNDPAKAADALHQALKANHGWAASRFLRRLTADLQEDEAGLKARLERYFERFLSQADVRTGDGTTRRRAMQFAAVYAAGQLGVDYDILPFKRLLHHILAVWKRAESLRAAPKDATSIAMQRVRQHLQTHFQTIIDLDLEPAPSLSDKKVNASPGFLKTFKGQRCLLLRGTCLRQLFGAKDRQALEELQAAGRLITVDGDQIQTRVRANEAKTRVYAIAID